MFRSFWATLYKAYTVCIKQNYTLVGSPPKFILYDISMIFLHKIVV